MSRSTLTLVALLVVAVGAESALAGPFGLFGRRWERRRAELYGDLSASLSAQLDAQLSEEMERARAELAKAAAKRLDREAAALKAQVARQVAEMRKEAAQLVADESKRLHQQVEREIAALRQQAQEIVKKEAAKLSQEVAQAKKELRQQVAGELAKLPRMVDERVEARWTQWVKSQSTEASQPDPSQRDSDKPEKSPANNDAARVRPTTEASEE